MILKKLVVGPLYTNCYILASEESLEAAVIDPGGDGEKIFALLKEENLKLKKIINTHGHFDHTVANDDLVKATGAKVYIHPRDLKLFLSSSKRLLPSLEFPIELSGGQLIKLGNLRLKIWHTPGHTRGSVSIQVGERLFSGDLLFKGSIGRTDLPESSWEEMVKSFKEKILVLPDETRIYPGHGDETVLGIEKKTNPFLKNIIGN